MLEQLLQVLRRVFGFQLTVAQWISIAIITGTPYLLVGVIWSATHTHRLHDMSGIDLAVSVLGSTALWPVLLLTNACTP